MICTPLALYILISFIYLIFLIVDMNNVEKQSKKTRSEILWTVVWLVLWGFIIGWFCYNSDEAAAWWLLILPWILGITLVLFLISMLFFLIAGGGCKDGYIHDAGANKYNLAQIQQHIRETSP